MKTGRDRTHGKTILVGEHAVVYGKPAIAIPFKGVWLEVTVRPADEDHITCVFHTGTMNTAPSGLKPVTTLYYRLKKHLGLPPCAVIIESTIPTGSGLGSSAAAASALTGAMYQSASKHLDIETRFEWTQFAETIAHGNPSGIDARATTQNQAFYFIKDKDLKPFDSRLDAWLVLGDSGESSDTKKAIHAVRRTLEDKRNVRLVDNLAEITDKAYSAYINNDAKTLGNLMNGAQVNLEALGVATPNIKAMTVAALENGALGAKLTGGGMGGFVIALAPSEHQAVAIRDTWVKEETKDVFILDLSKEVP